MTKEIRLFFPSAKIIIRHPSNTNKILLVRRSVRNAVFYEPAGGKAEIDFEKRVAENLEECALREVREELGLTVKIEQYLGSYYFFWVIDPSKCSSCAVFVGSIVDEDRNFVSNADVNELPIKPAWVTIDDILDKKISIDASYVGLEELIMNYCRRIKNLSDN